jgi:ligand-binding SRPBCC domain-containing protein
MKLSRLEFEQFVPLSLEDTWEFFSSPKNLDDITPDDMKFQILSNDVDKMYEGQIIEYKVSPFSGISFRWVTEITHVRNQSFFVDEQRFGPYSFWHHRHQFEVVDGGVLMKDILHYKLPLGIMGKFIDHWVVRKKVISIFRYRFLVIENKFDRLGLDLWNGKL